jgi:predicted amidohydrolase YtcJ
MSSRLLVRGRIFTSDPEQPWAEAMTVDGEMITHVGTLDDAIAAAGPDAELIDAGDGVVLPGFVDGHAHLLHAGAALTRAALRPCTSMDEIEAELRRWVASNPDARRVLGVGWVFSALPDSTPTRQLLDAIVPDTPVYLDASDLHSVWCNTAALAELGIADDTPDPIGGTIVRDVQGHATGLLLENAGYVIAWPVINAATDADNDRFLRTAVEAYLAAGTTTAVDMACDDDTLTALERADAAGELPFTVVAHWLISRRDDPADELAQVRTAAKMVARHERGRIRVAGIKLVTDGTIDGCTAGMCQPFTNDEPGEMVWPRERLEPVMLLADELGLQIACHAIGDLAVRTVLDVFEIAAAQRAERGDTRERRHRIEHLEYVDATDVGRLAPLGVTASMQPVHVDPAYLDNWVELLGHERAQRGFAWPEFLEHGTTLAFGTDVPTAQHHPLPNMYIAATRRSPYVPDAVPLRPDFALPLEHSVVHGTRDSAWASFEEAHRGTLHAGLIADFVVLDGDPFRDGPERLLTTKVVRTVVAGRTVHSA